MNLNAYIIRDYLKETVLWDCIQEDLTGLPYENVSIYEKDTPLEVSVIYLISPGDFEREYERLSHGAYIITGDCRQIPSMNSLSVICVQSARSTANLLHQVQEIFRFFYEWEISLYQILGRNGSLREYGVCSLEIFNNPIALYTSAHRNVFFCENQKPRHLTLFHEEDVNAYLSDTEIEDMRLDPVFQATIRATRPTIYPADMWGYRILYDNLHIENVYVARIMVCEFDQPIRESDHALLRILTSFLEHGIRHQDILFNSHPENFDACITGLLQEQPLEEPVMNAALSNYGWRLGDSYFCILIPVNSQDQFMHTAPYVCSRLESSVAGSAAIIYGEYIVLIVNQERALLSRDEILSQLIYIQRENLLKAGVSNIFTGLQNLAEYYRQALAALSIGSKSDPTLWIFRYESYAYRHLLLRASQGSSMEALCPFGLLQLMQYDRMHRRTYTRSLKAFIENQMSVSKAIQQLYIQRATFIYQLKRIKEISGLDLNDKSCQFQLLIVFQIMDEKKYELP